jgi:hypothetical protein
LKDVRLCLGIFIITYLLIGAKCKFENELSKAQAYLPDSMLNNTTPTNYSKKNQTYTIAFIVPVFTTAAYNNAFYFFYEKYAKSPPGINITTDLDLLSAAVTASKNHETASMDASSLALPFLEKHTRLLVPKENVSVLTDIDVDRGLIFHNKSNIYDVLILAHQEYVTQKEYNNFKQFVKNGGTLILLDSNVFFAEVGYDLLTQVITLVKGHGWQYNGKTAWKSVEDRWKKETSNWTGSNYICSSCKVTFVHNPFDYEHMEEQNITNVNSKLVFNYNASVLPSSPVLNNATLAHKYRIGIYELDYGNGHVISFGIYADKVINNKQFLVLFDKLLLYSLARS